MCPNLFVYGTLLSKFDSVNARVLAAEAEFLGPAWLGGRLYRVNPRYPGLVLSGDPGNIVRGEVFRMGNPARLLARLDEYEGCAPHSPKPFEYERLLVSAQLAVGFMEVWTYVYRLLVREEDLITSGIYEGPASV